MKIFKKLTVTALTAVIAVTASFAGVAAAADSLKGKITVNGSTALLPLTLQAAKEFQKLHPKVKIAASGKGSVTGPQAVKKASLISALATGMLASTYQASKLLTVK